MAPNNFGYSLFIFPWLLLCPVSFSLSVTWFRFISIYSFHILSHVLCHTFYFSICFMGFYHICKMSVSAQTWDLLLKNDLTNLGPEGDSSLQSSPVHVMSRHTRTRFSSTPVQVMPCHIHSLGGFQGHSSAFFCGWGGLLGHVSCPWWWLPVCLFIHVFNPREELLLFMFSVTRKVRGDCSSLCFLSLGRVKEAAYFHVIFLRL